LRDRITSLSNPKVKRTISLHRRRVRNRERLFVAEGVRLVEEGLKARTKPTALFITEEAAAGERARDMLGMARDRGVSVTSVNQAVMSVMSVTETPQGILAIFPFLEHGVPEKPTLTLVVDRLRDPGNMGTMLRSADAAGVDEVLLTRRTVDIYNPKVVRAGMGSHFRVPIRFGMSWQQIGQAVEGMGVALADANGNESYEDVPWRDPWALIVGGEAEGSSNEARSLADRMIRIPCRGGIESLNAAVAGSVILFEARRQRRAGGTT
jgi:TrmH family RNA methyltransferase